MSGLNGRVVLITGGGRGIGRAYAEALAGAGALIVIADIIECEAVAEALSDIHGVPARAFMADVSDEQDVQRLVDGVIDAFGRIDVLVNNAAKFASLPLAAYDKIDVETWDEVMAVNVRGPFLMVKHVAPHMIRQGGGKIINISSGTAYKGMPEMLAYVTSKAALLGFTRTLARELGRHNICVNTLAPGLIESEGVLAHERMLEASEKVIQSRSIQRPGLPQDVVGALVFLASADSDFVTGQTIAVDGGSIMT